MPDPWRSRKKCSPPRRRFLVEPRQAAANRFSRITKHETRPLLWRGMGRLWRGMGGDCPPHRQHGFMHFTNHETRDTNHGFYAFLPTIARHCPRLPAKKMLQALVASQYGRGSRGPGRVPRAAPRQPGCTVEPTNHEPRSFLARGASRREFRGFHESRVTKHESRLFFAVGAPGWRHRKPPSGPLRPPASRCFPVHRCSPLFTIVHYCSPLFAIVHPKILFGASLHVSPCGEAKWVRGPSGRGASRAEEKGASRLARAGVLAKSPPSPLGSRNTASPVHRPSGRFFWSVRAKPLGARRCT